MGSVPSRSAEEVAKRCLQVLLNDDPLYIPPSGEEVKKAAAILQTYADGVRADALEEAAKRCAKFMYGDGIAPHIRALAEQPAAPDQKGASCTSRLD